MPPSSSEHSAGSDLPVESPEPGLPDVIKERAYLLEERLKAARRVEDNELKLLAARWALRHHEIKVAVDKAFMEEARLGVARRRDQIRRQVELTEANDTYYPDINGMKRRAKQHEDFLDELEATQIRELDVARATYKREKKLATKGKADAARIIAEAEEALEKLE